MREFGSFTDVSPGVHSRVAVHELGRMSCCLAAPIRAVTEGEDPCAPVACMHGADGLLDCSSRATSPVHPQLPLAAAAPCEMCNGG